MLDPRIYRMGLIPVLLAVIVLAFSLGDQQPPLVTTLAPDAFNGAGAYSRMVALAKQFPDRRPGSAGDNALADKVAGQLRTDGFTLAADRFRGSTVDATRTLENVVAIRAGQQNGSIVVVAGRDALSSPAAAQLSGTAVLLELARLLNGETLQHTVVLASTSGSDGGAGATELAHTLQLPVDGVIVLGDLAGTTAREPVVVPWSNSQQLAPTELRSTLAGALRGQAGLAPGSTSLLGQLAHLAFPMAATAQAPFVAGGDPAVLLSLSGEQTPAGNERTDPAQITAMGRTVLQTINAIDGGATLPPPFSYLDFSGKIVPAWAVRLLALALIVPVLGATIDGAARARRRGHRILRWVCWVAASATPFVLAALLVLAAPAVGVVQAAPPGPVGGGAITLHNREVVVLAILGCVIVGGLVWLRRAVARLAAPRQLREDERLDTSGAAAGVLLVLSVVAVAVWVANPFAALLLVPALHLWMWIVVPDVRLPVPALIVMLLAGLALPGLVAFEYASTLGLGPAEAAWSWTLLLAGGGVGFFSALEWSLYLGAAVSVIAIAARTARNPRPEAVPVTIRGPVTYAGPGSLGGTESALRR